MKTVSVGMAAALARPVQTLAWGMKVTRSHDGAVSGWTSHHKRKTVTVDGQPLVLLPSHSIAISTIARSAGWEVDNLEATVLQFDQYMTRADLLDGRWEGSTFSIFQFDWSTPANGVLPWLAGSFGRVKPRQGAFVIELRDLRQFLRQDTTRRTQTGCDFEFGDPATCTVSLGPLTTTGVAVTGVTSQRQFTAASLGAAADTFTDGLVTWTTGLNAGSIRKVYRHPGSGVIELALPTIRPLQVGDTFTIVEGCLRTRAACIARGNVLNFPGFDQKPKTDEMTGGAVVEP